MSTITAESGSHTATPADTASFWRAAWRGASSVILIAVLALAIALAVVPRLMGGQALTVLTGSMEPTYSPGDMVVTVPQDDYGIGDVVTFQPVSGDPMLITHRIVGIQVGNDGTSYTTRGDANGATDGAIERAQIMGEVIYDVPYVGHLAVAAGEHRNALIAIAGAALIGYGVYSVGSDQIGKRRRKRAEASS